MTSRLQTQAQLTCLGRCISWRDSDAPLGHEAMDTGTELPRLGGGSLVLSWGLGRTHHLPGLGL